MSKAAELIADLSTDAAFDSDGGFTLDRDKAREKMRQFQLADPHRYVLLLVEAAVLRGASQIEFDIDSDDMRMRFDAGLEWEDLDELYTSLFVDRTSVEIRARRELALAANAVMALNPRYCLIESVGRNAEGERVGVRARLRPDVEDEIERFDPPAVSTDDEALDTGEVWTRIHVKERFRPGLLVRFVRDLQAQLPEELLIESCCSLASIPISLDGRRISVGLPKDLIDVVGFETEELRGVAGLVSDDARRRRSVIVLVSNGVEIATHELGEGVGGLWFWVESTRFRKDVSQADIVRNDPAYARALEAVRGARDRVLGRLVELWADGSYFAEETRPTQDQVFDLLRACFLRFADPSWLLPNAGPLGRLAEVPLWQLVDGQWTSPVELAEALGPARPPGYSTWDSAGLMPLDWPPTILIAGGELELEAVKRVYPEAKDVTARLMTEAPWEFARQRWRERTHAIELPAMAGAHMVRYEQGEHRGVVALSVGGQSDVRIVVEDALLAEVALDLGLGVVVLSAVITGPLTPTHDYKGPGHDRGFAASLLLLLAQLPKLLVALARDQPETIKPCLIALTRPQFAREWLECFGFETEVAETMLARIGEPQLLPDLALVHGQPDSALAAALSFETVDRRPATLATISHEQRIRGEGKVGFVDRSATPTDTPLVEFLLWLDADERRVLAAVFGARALEDRSTAYRRDRKRREFLAKPEQSPSAPSTTWSVAIDVEIDGHHIHGHVGVGSSQIRSWKPDEARTATIEVLTQCRLLCIIRLPTWIPGVEASLAWDDAPINADFDGLEGKKLPLRRTLEHGIVALMRERAEASAGQRPSEDVRRLLWMGVVSPFVCAELFRAWTALRRANASDFAEACARYFELMKLYPGVPLRELRSAIALLLEEGELATASTVLDTLGRKPKRALETEGGRTFHKLVLDIFPVLERVALVDTCTGPVELAELTASYEQTKELPYVEDASVRWAGERLILRSDAIDDVGLIRLFGANAMTEVSGWIHEQAHQQRFEAQAQLDALRVEGHKRLVGVEFEHEGLRGELAIPNWSAGEGSDVKLTMCHERRVIENLIVHGPLPIIGLIDDPEAQLSADFTRLDKQGSRMAVVRKAVSRICVDQLLPRLAELFPNLDMSGQDLARSWIYAHWRRKSPRAGRYPNRLDEPGRAFATLPLFRDVGGQARSLDELIERYEAHERKLWYVERHPGYVLDPPFPILEARGQQLSILTALFPQVTDFSPRWAARVTGEDNKRRADPMPSEVPEDTLITATFDRHGLEGTLWLPARQPIVGGVVCGSDGKVVEIHQPVAWLPCRGFIGGGLAVDDYFEAISFTGPQRRYIAARAIYLYSRLLSAHERDLARPDRPDFLEPAQVEARKLHLSILRDAALALARARTAGEGFDAILANFERRINACPLLRMDTGRMISIELAREIRPFGFSHLGIWDPNLPPVDPAERARLLLGESAPEQEPSKTKAKSAADERGETNNEGEEAVEAESLVEPPGSLDQDEATIIVDGIEELLEIEPMSSDEKSTEAPEAEAEVEAPAIDPVYELLERIRAELRLLRDQHEVVLSEGLLDRIGAERRKGKRLVVIDDGVWFDSNHPRFIRALEDPDPIWVSFLASTAYTALNTWLEKITDEHEIAFHHSHAQFVLSSLLEG